MMRSDLVVYLVVGSVLIVLIFLPRWLWRRGQTAPTVPKRTRAKQEPKPFAGYTDKPECVTSAVKERSNRTNVPKPS